MMLASFGGNACYEIIARRFAVMYSRGAKCARCSQGHLCMDTKSPTNQCKATTSNSTLISDWFSDKGNSIKDGFYTVELSCPIDKVLPDKIRSIFGERNRNIYGNCVKFDPIGGNTIHFCSGILIKNKNVQIIDLQQKISEL